MNSLAQLLTAFPKVELLAGATAVTPLTRLSAELGGPKIFIKRDDCSPLALGGNKIRKLEYVVGDACARGADTLLTCGGPQSNHARLTAAAAALMGLHCTVLLAPWPENARGPEFSNGNVLLDQLLGANIVKHSSDEGMTPVLEAMMVQLRSEGREPYLIGAGASSALGSMGYVACAQELSAQMEVLGLDISSVVHATGSCGTQAGLLAGFQHMGQPVQVLGVAVSPDEGQAFRRGRVSELCEEIFSLLKSDNSVPRSAIEIEGNFCGPDYGIADEATLEAIELVARLEGVLLDPVYTGKAMAALIARVRSGYWRVDDVIVFLHTGGAVALFATHDEWSTSQLTGTVGGQYQVRERAEKQTVDQIS